MREHDCGGCILVSKFDVLCCVQGKPVAGAILSRRLAVRREELDDRSNMEVLAMRGAWW